MHTNPFFSRVKQFFLSCFRWDKPFVRSILFITLPMILQELVAASLHIIDGLMVSGLGDAAYSAVTQANRFTFIFQLFIFGVSSGSAIFFSQYWGARDIPRMRHAMGLALMSSMLLTLFFSLAGLLFPRQIISLFLPQGESFELAVSYLRIVAPGYLLMAVNVVYAACLKAAEKTYIPMFSGLAGIAVNTVLNYILIYGKLGFAPRGVLGAAEATVIASAVSLLSNLAFSYIKHLPAGATLREMRCRDKAFIRKFFITVLPVIFNEGLWATGVSMYSICYGRMGDLSVAAVGIATTINDLVWVFLMSMTNAAAIMVGKALGEHKPDRAYLYAKRLMAAGFVIGLGLGLVLILSRGPLTGLFTGLSPATRGKAQQLILIAGLGLAIRAFNCINVVGVLRSGGDTLYSMALDVGTLWLVGVPLVALASLVWGWPIEWVYLCTFADEILKFLVGIPHFFQKKWIHILTAPKEAEASANP